MSSRGPLAASIRRGPWRAPLALSSPLLILLALLALGQRAGGDRWQVLPALLIGCGLLASSWWHRRRRRRQLLLALRQHEQPAKAP